MPKLNLDELYIKKDNKENLFNVDTKENESIEFNTHTNSDSNNTPFFSSNNSQSNDTIYGKKIQWKRGPTIHSGENSIIYKALNIKNGNIFVVKEYTNIRSEGISIPKKNYFKEVKNLKKIKHLNIINLIGAEVVNDNHYLYLDYISGGTLSEFIEKFGCLNEPLVRNLLKQILNALDYINSLGLTYNNLLMKHLLIDSEGQLKLIDFSNVKAEKNKSAIGMTDELNSDVTSFSKIVSEIYDKCKDKPDFLELPLFREYKSFVYSNEIRMVSYKELKNHPFVR